MTSKRLLVLLLLSSPAFADDQRDQDIFGDASADAKPAPSSSQQLIDTLQIGGRLEVRNNSAQEEQQKFPESSYTQLKRADIYFDTRPNKDLRALLRVRLSEQRPASSTATAAKTELDELWFKWDLSDSVFFTLGKQHLKWGSARIWNPTDFTAVSTRDPLALFDSRLGQELLKIHLPIEKQGFNYYVILQFDDMKRDDEIGAALRAEFAFGGIGETAFSFQTRQDQPMRFGADISSALGPIDVYLESAASRRETRTFYEGDIDPSAGVLPTNVDRKDDTFLQAVAGVQYSFKYSDDDNFTVGGEYFENGLGYDDRELELYSMLLGQSSPLYAGRRYAAAYIRLPQPGSWNDTSFFLNALHNLVDETSVVRFTTTWQLYKDATVEAFVSQCLGDYGELCFRIPEKFRALAASPSVPVAQQQILAALPDKRTKNTLGIAMSINF